MRIIHLKTSEQISSRTRRERFTFAGREISLIEREVYTNYSLITTLLWSKTARCSDVTMQSRRFRDCTAEINISLNISDTFPARCLPNNWTELNDVVLVNPAVPFLRIKKFVFQNADTAVNFDRYLFLHPLRLRCASFRNTLYNLTFVRILTKKKKNKSWNTL